MDWIQNIATDIALILAPLAIYVEWKVGKETKDLEDRIAANSEKIDRRFDINENDLTVVATEIRRDIKHLFKRVDRLQEEIDFCRRPEE